jgi:hypothetical protein
MEVKLFEVRDAGTFAPCMGIRLGNSCEEERYLLARAGYGKDSKLQEMYVLFTCILPGYSKIEYDTMTWGDRTFQTAHEFVEKHWDALVSGQVVDVQHILGERDTPKISERVA